MLHKMEATPLASETGFPNPIDLPAAVHDFRRARTRRLIRIALFGVGIRLVVIAMELAGYWALRHSVLLVDAAASIADVVASVTIVAAIVLAQRPPDHDHPFGHGRYEPIAGLQLGVLIAVAGMFLLGQQLVVAVQQPAAGEVSRWVWLIPAIAALLLEITNRTVVYIGRRENSSALIAEALHYRIDALSSLLASAGLAVAAYFPTFSQAVDHGCAMLLALIMVGLGVLAARENLHQLMDRAPDQQWFDRVRESAARVEGVLEVEKVRIQNAGPDAHVDIDVEVAPAQTVQEAHRIAQRVRARIQIDWPAVREVVVHVEP